LGNKDIEMSEMILAVDTFQDYTTPGNDTILSRDFTVLLHIEEGTKSEDNEQGWVILNFLLGVLKSFWQNGNMPKQAKETVIRPFLKSEDEDPTNPKFYRPIALLSTVRKVYEQILKNRLQNALEDIKFFAKSQAAYRKLRSTSDHHLVVQELFFDYRYKNASDLFKLTTPLYLSLIVLKKHLILYLGRYSLLNWLQLVLLVSF